MRTDGRRLLTVGVTGPTGAGKSSLRPAAQRAGFVWLDSDAAAREVVLPGAPALGELARRFGSDVIRADGTLDRALLAQRAFPTREGREALNAITHPHIIRMLLDGVEKAHAAGLHAVIDAPLLFEADLDERCDTTVAVTADTQTRIGRVMLRDNITRQAAELRVGAQQPEEFYTTRAEFRVDNSGSERELDALGDELFARILNKYC